MKLLLSWLKEHIALEQSPETLSTLLTSAGLEVESIEKVTDDWLLTIGLTPNLNHCASVSGIARELAALNDQTHHQQTATVQNEGAEAIGSKVAVEVQEPEKCPRYACRLIQGVKVGPSPDWLKGRLELSGIRSINNVVDATNYILLELGHPLHAFDFGRIVGGEIIVRDSRPAEVLVTLDGKQRELPPGTLLICDRDQPVAIAGVMGGLDSEVGTRTTDVLLEAAYFHPAAIRRTSKALQLQTDASRRFERGTDPNAVLEALDRTTVLICELAGGDVARGTIDIKKGDFPERQIDCRVSRVNALLGQHLAINEIEAVFKRLGFPYKWNRQGIFQLSIPTYRNDILAEVDLIEEVARLYGYDHIEKQAGHYQSSRLPHAPIFLFENEVRSRLIGSGLQEFLTCDLIGPTILQAIQGQLNHDPETIQVLNPTSIEQSILRRSLLPGLLQVVKLNVDRKTEDLSGFEIGRIHFKQSEFYKEESVAAIVLTGKQHPHHWESKSTGVDFYDLKGYVEELLKGLGFERMTFKASGMKSLHPGRQAGVFVNEFEVGVIGEVHPAVLQRLDINQTVFFGELNLHSLYRERPAEPRMKELPLYPGSERDWTVTVPHGIPFTELCKPLREEASELLENVELIDVYRGPNVEAGHQNLTLRFTYRDRRKTVLQDEVETEHKRLTEKVESMLKTAEN